MSWATIADGMRGYYAVNFLPHACTIRRPSGTGSSAGFTNTATGVACRFVAADPRDWSLEPGAVVGKVMYTVRFKITQDVQVGDQLVRTDVSGEAPTVRGVKPADGYEPVKLALAESRA